MNIVESLFCSPVSVVYWFLSSPPGAVQHQPAGRVGAQSEQTGHVRRGKGQTLSASCTLCLCAEISYNKSFSE